MNDQQRRVAAKLRHQGNLEMLRDGRRNRSAQFADGKDRLQARKPKHVQARGMHHYG